MPAMHGNEGFRVGFGAELCGTEGNEMFLMGVDREEGKVGIGNIGRHLAEFCNEIVVHLHVIDWHGRGALPIVEVASMEDGDTTYMNKEGDANVC